MQAVIMMKMQRLLYLHYYLRLLIMLKNYL
nr:MAG TPA: hypothetical protein [Caudoviricetes sp.]